MPDVATLTQDAAAAQLDDQSCTVTQALADYRTVMVRDNRRYLNKLLDTLLLQVNMDDEEKMTRFVKACCGEDNYYGIWPSSPEDGRRFLRDLEKEHPHFDGTITYPRSGEDNQAYFTALEIAINRVADKSVWTNAVPLPHDYKELCTLVGHIEDPDFRGAWPAPIDGTPDSPLSASEERVRIMHRRRHWSGWQLVTGFQLGVGPEGESSHEYLFCRCIDDDADGEHKDWGWRVLYKPSMDRSANDADESEIFNGLVPLLHRLANWYPRTNIEWRINYSVNEVLV